MGKRINISAVLLCTVLIMPPFGAAGLDARAEEPGGQDLQVLMAEAEKGIPEAQYRLGQHYETQYDLGNDAPDATADHTNLLLAFAWFQSAENAGHRDARYARIATEYALRAVYDDEEFRQAMESIREWMKSQSPPSPPQAEAQPPAQPAEVSVAATPEDATAQIAPEIPPEASTELAAGDENSDAEPGIALAPAPPPEPTPESTSNRAPEAVPARATDPDIEKLLARGTSFLEAGDLVSARGFFKLAAGRGSGDAAMLVGVTYDPGYLELARVVGLRPNPEQAEAWYLKAIEMDNEEAESRLRALKRRLGQ